MGSIVVRNSHASGKNNEVRIYCKGAPDFVLKKTTRVVNVNGQILDIEDSTKVPSGLLGDGGKETDTHRNVFERTIKNFANQAYRTILTTFREMSMEEFNKLKASNNDFKTDADRICLE